MDVASVTVTVPLAFAENAVAPPVVQRSSFPVNAKIEALFVDREIGPTVCRDPDVPAVMGEAMVTVPPVRLVMDTARAPALPGSVMSMGAFVSVMLPELPGDPLSAIAAEPLKLKLDYALLLK